YPSLTSKRSAVAFRDRAAVNSGPAPRARQGRCPCTPPPGRTSAPAQVPGAAGSALSEEAARDLRFWRSDTAEETGRAMNAEPSSILIVDDEELNSEALARRLQGHGYAVTVAKSGPEAIDLLGERRVDLVLLDIMMPGMSGLEVLKVLRRVDSLIDLPILMVTAKGESEDMVEALERGANDYVTKPIDFPVVLARIRTQLALRRAVSQVTELEQKLGAPNKQKEVGAPQLPCA